MKLNACNRLPITNEIHACTTTIISHHITSGSCVLTMCMRVYMCVYIFWHCAQLTHRMDSIFDNHFTSFFSSFILHSIELYIVYVPFVIVYFCWLKRREDTQKEQHKKEEPSPWNEKIKQFDNAKFVRFV